MPRVKSMGDLQHVRDAALRQREAERAESRALILVGLGTPGVALGARETLQAFRDVIEQDGLTGIVVRQTGSFGLDSREPVVQVIAGDGPAVLYGNVTPALARCIVREHVLGGTVLGEHVIA